MGYYYNTKCFLSIALTIAIQLNIWKNSVEACENLRNYRNGIVCVCDTNYCDTIPDLKIDSLSDTNYQIYSTSSSKLGMYMTEGTFGANSSRKTAHVKLVKTIKYQTIFGYGGAFTDSTGLVIASLPTKLQNDILESYFGDSGIEYSLCRIPMGATDFSVRLYSYDDVPGDVKLEHFNLAQEDLQYKIPLIRKAQQLRGNKTLNFYTSPWTAPPWMKSIQGWTGPGVLKPENYQVWANYAVRFFQEYAKHNITFWGMTVSNEPYLIGFTPPPNEVPAMGWTIYKLNDYVGNYLGPTIRNSSFSHLKIMIHDDSRNSLHLVIRQLNDEKALKYIDGVAMHWYEDGLYLPKYLKYAQTPKKDTFVLYTESCFQGGPSLGNWSRAESYVKDIMQDLKYNVTGWVDWNMALDLTGGPTFTLNYLDAPILVNPIAQEFYKQPMYYALGHFAKFLIPGSVRVHLDLNLKNVDVVVNAFERPDGLTLLLIYNSGITGAVINVEGNSGKMANIEVAAKSINSMLFK